MRSKRIMRCSSRRSPKSAPSIFSALVSYRAANSLRSASRSSPSSLILAVAAASKISRLSVAGSRSLGPSNSARSKRSLMSPSESFRSRAPTGMASMASRRSRSRSPSAWRKSPVYSSASASARSRCFGVLLLRSSSPPFLRAPTRSAVSTMLPPSFAGVALRCLTGDELVKRRAFAVLFAEDAAEALHMLSYRAGARDDDRDICVGDVHTFIEHARCDDRADRPFGERREDGAPLAHLRLVCDGGDQKPPRDGVGGRVILREDQRSIVPMLAEEVVDIFELLWRAEGELALPPICLHGAPPFFAR